MQNTKKIRVASFFAGAGGLDLGFHQAGFDIVYASDIEGDCCKTLELNKGISISRQSEVQCGDIRNIDFTSLPANIDLVVGGPPCQSFSASGRRAGGAAGRLDERGNLFESYSKIIGFLSPRAFVFENVRGIFATNKGQDWQEILDTFHALGYTVDYRLLDAADFGVPQHRERVFLIGHKMNQPFLFPQPKFGPDSPNDVLHVSPKAAFRGLRLRQNEAEATRFEGGKYSHLLPEVPEGQNYLYFTTKRGHPSPIFAYRSRFSDFLYKAHPDYPMKTIIASPGKYTGPLHWKNRYFSIPEYKAIQGFPQSYSFYGDRASVVKQIGNSVSPLIAKQIALAISHQVFGASRSVDYLMPDEVLSFDKRKGIKAAKTRAMHKSISDGTNNKMIFSRKQRSFDFSVAPNNFSKSTVNVRGERIARQHELVVRYDEFSKQSAEIELKFWGVPKLFEGHPEATLRIALFGNSNKVPQLLWNSVDEWVRNVTSFHSLFELYGHFTEPYPFFKVSKFETLDDNSVLGFARFVSNFEKCSTYLDKQNLLQELGETFCVSNFDDLANQLRTLRYDIRTRETNIAIPKGKYMIAYPFTLPQSKQMNFSIKRPRTDQISETYINEKRYAF